MIKFLKIYMPSFSRIAIYVYTYMYIYENDNARILTIPAIKILILLYN